MLGMVRAQSLRGYRELVAELGGDSARLLRDVGMRPAILNEQTALISFEDQADLLGHSAQRLHCPDFGLRLADRQDLGILGVLAVAIQYSATLDEGARCASKYLHVHNSAVDLTISTERRSGHARIWYALPSEDYVRWAQQTEHALGFTWRILVLLSEGKCHLQEVRFPHRALADEATYHARFDAPVIFGATLPTLIIPAKDLKISLSENIPELQDIARKHLESQLPRRKMAFVDQVRRAVEGLLGTGSCGHRSVAGNLFMHQRTLQRRLRNEGTSFEAIKDDARKELAKRYLAQPDVSFAQIAGLLDYKDPSGFTRSCRRWFNATPRQMRTRLSD